MKLILMILLMTANFAFAQSNCDVRLGSSVGVRVIEFASGNVVHSKIALKEMSASHLREEIMNLQDLGVCDTKLQVKRCVLKFEKKANHNQLTLIRGTDRWLSWGLTGKASASKFVKILQKAGLCT